jgi:hypothetical protein
MYISEVPIRRTGTVSPLVLASLSSPRTVAYSISFFKAICGDDQDDVIE